jgi:hypothetical protein
LEDWIIAPLHHWGGDLGTWRFDHFGILLKSPNDQMKEWRNQQGATLIGSLHHCIIGEGIWGLGDLTILGFC